MFLKRDDLKISAYVRQLFFASSDSFVELGQPWKCLNLRDFLRLFSDQISPNNNSEQERHSKSWLSHTSRVRPTVWLNCIVFPRPDRQFPARRRRWWVISSCFSCAPSSKPHKQHNKRSCDRGQDLCGSARETTGETLQKSWPNPSTKGFDLRPGKLRYDSAPATY